MFDTENKFLVSDPTAAVSGMSFIRKERQSLYCCSTGVGQSKLLRDLG